MPKLVPGTFLRRLNRFAVLVTVGGVETMAHLPNSGRLHELLIPGIRLYLAPRSGEARKTAYDMALVDLDGTLVSCDARLPPSIVAEAHRQGLLPDLVQYPRLRREPAFGEGRFDLLLEGDSGACLVETKSVTLVEEGVALFPDAPTTRGTRHLYGLIEATRQGFDTAVLFVVQRGDAVRFAPWEEADPAFAQALREAASAGVQVQAYLCDVTLTEIRLAQPIPVWLE